MHVLNFPAVAEEDEHHIIESIFGTRTIAGKAGEALHPERESLESLRRTREDIGEYYFLSQYQQAPYIRAYEPPAGTDKIMRLFAQSHHFEAGKVLLPSNAPWLDEYRRELTSFPGAKHDDQVDSTTQARTLRTRSRGVNETPGPRRVSACSRSLRVGVAQ